MGLAKRMETEWQMITNSTAATATFERWKLAEPVLVAWPTLPQLRAATEDREDPARSDSILAALARLAAHDGGDDPLAARVLLQLLLPGAVRLGRRVTRLFSDPEESEATVLAELALQIKTYPWQRRPARVAANLLLDTHHVISQAARRGRLEAVAADPDAVDGSETTNGEVTSERAEVIDLFAWATRTGVLSPSEAVLIAANRIDETSIADLAKSTGRSQPTLFRIRSRAERRLRLALIADAA